MATVLKETSNRRGQFRIIMVCDTSNALRVQEKKWYGWNTVYEVHNDQNGFDAVMNRFNIVVQGV